MHKYLIYFAGNIPLHILTFRNNYKLRIDPEDREGNKSYANYQLFRIGSPLDLYKFEVVGYSGTAGTAHSAMAVLFVSYAACFS